MARQALEVMLSDPRSLRVHACVCMCVHVRERVQGWGGRGGGVER